MDPSCLLASFGWEAWGFGGRRRKSRCCLWGTGWNSELEKGGGGLIFHCGQCGGYQASLFFPPFPFSLSGSVPGTRHCTVHTHTHTHTTVGIANGAGTWWWAAAWIGMLGAAVGFLISVFFFGRRTDGVGLVWSGLFFFGTGKQHPSCSHHITSPHDGTSTLHCTAPTLLDGGRTSGQGYRLASSVGPAASLSTTSLVIQHTKLLSLSSFVGLLAACVEIIGGRGGVGSCHHGYIYIQ